MRYPKDHKEQARRRLVEGGARLAKKRGFAAAGVDDLAAAAGVTSGAVYNHFGGKSELLAAIIEAELGRSAARFVAVRAGNDRAQLDKALDAYLSAEHVGHPELGCALPSLAADVARAAPEVRAAFEDGLLAVHAALRGQVRSSDAAWALIAQSVGAVMLARAMQDEPTRRKLLTAVKRNARALVRGPSEDE